MPLASERLREIVTEFASRPRHEKVRTLVYELLVNGLDASSSEVDFERPVPEVHGRIDALLGRTVFEFKSDLRRERQKAEDRLVDYLAQRESETGERFVGIATDGATFLAYERLDGVLRSLGTFVTSIDRPRDLLAWLSSAVAVSADLEPTPDIVRRELGRESLAWQVANGELASLWRITADIPEVRLKRDLWARLLERVYGAPVGADALFFQHTYLSIIAKTMALHVLGFPIPEPDALLNGRPFHEAGIGGVVEADFFDWVLAGTRGPELVRRVALQAARFRLRDVKTDVLKGLYESLVDPEQRRYLGEYYTPDWLASRICERAIERPLEQRVLDPACGSGTFIFHAVRRVIDAAEVAGLSSREAITRASGQIFGVDVHPVAVQIARVTFLLALGVERLRHRPPNLTVPVYLGDSLQWNTRGFLAEREVLVEVPGEGMHLEFPFQVARDPGLFDTVIDQMLSLSESNTPSDGLRNWLARVHPLDKASLDTVVRTYETLRLLHQEKRDHIWGFVSRNLVRPVWLSQEDQRADVVIGNPPWLSYRYMEPETQKRFREECMSRGLWMGQVAQQQDLSAYFFVRCVELYLKAAGIIAFVMPYAAMTRRQFAGFRTGIYRERKSNALSHVFASIQFTQAWSFSDHVSPLFPVPSCVLFAENERASRGQEIGTGRLPSTVLEASGRFSKRDATSAEAESSLEWREIPWPSERRDRFTAGYAGRFRQGAIVIPRVLCVVEDASVSRLGENLAAPVVHSRRTSQEKAPWKSLPVLQGNVEREFLRPLYLGESIVPFRFLAPITAVIPWDQTSRRLFDAAHAQLQGYAHLARWLAEAEGLWDRYGRGKRTFGEQIDYYGQLSAQLPVPPLRVAYAKSGTLPAAAILKDTAAIIDHTLYWLAPASAGEAGYLCSILNSETARSRAEHLQSRGQWGARHFDKVMLSLPIPRYDHKLRLHRELSLAGEHAERVAATVPLGERMHFVTARKRIREALQQDGVAQHIEESVTQLLGPI